MEKQLCDLLVHLILLTWGFGAGVAVTADPGRDLKRGTSLALQCTLLCNGGIADCSSVPDNVKLTWVDDEGTALQGDRFKITPYRTHSTLSLELQTSDHNRRWRCNLTEEGTVKASYSYTTTLKGSADRISPLHAGSNATLTCSLTCGFVCPPAKLLWSDSNGSSLQGSAREGFLIRSNITSSQLFVTGLQSSEQIRCSVEEEGKQRVYLQYLIQVSAPGGRAFGLLKAQQEEGLDSINQEFLVDPKYSDVEDLDSKLEAFKKKYMEFDRNDHGDIEKYMEFDRNDHGDIDMMGLKRMLEKLGVAKTHLELKKMMSEVTGGATETISYKDFIRMMLGKRNGILKLILMYEGMAKDDGEKPSGPPPKKKIHDLP
ncbi:UNVERIFIED_CONTAM: hypothetical protein FKN15_061843 [Acipenser sinensis]